MKRVKGRFLLSFLAMVLVFGVSSSVFGQDNVYAEKKFALDWLGQAQQFERFGKIADAIWSYAELGLQEHQTSKLMIATMEKAGFKVEKGLAGMPTCFVASYGSGKPVIGILAEFDALPMLSQKAGVSKHEPIVAGAPGHGCGHNTMAAAAMAAAMAVKESMQKHGLKGTIRLFGSPAEETLVSRAYMVRDGLFKDVDAVIDNHLSDNFHSTYGVSGLATISTIFSFTGKTAHSALAPWSGRSALDAVELMNIAVNMLREHLFYTNRTHYVITDGGEAPNVVPDKASVWYFVRNSDDKVESDHQLILNAAKGAALATGAELAKVRVLTAIHQKYSNKAAAELFQKNIELVGMPEWTEEEHNFAKALQKELGKKEEGMATKVAELKKPPVVFTGGGSTDVGEVSLVVPTATVSFPGLPLGAVFHHWSTTTCTCGRTVWKGLNAGAKALAASALDLLTQPEELNKLQVEFGETSKKYPYHSYLPDDAAPPLEMYDELMSKFRPHMEKFYVTP